MSSHRRAEPAIRRLVTVAVLGAAVLTAAATADADVFHPAVDSSSLAAAVAAANANPGPDTIALASAADGHPYTASAPLEIAGDLTITGDHADQGATGGPAVDGSDLAPAGQPLFTIDAGVHARLEGFGITGVGGDGAAAVVDNGALELDNMALIANGGIGLVVDAGASTTAINSTVYGNHDDGIELTGGALTLINDTIAANGGWGIAAPSGFTVALINTIVAANAMGDCESHATARDASLDDDGSCGLARSASPLLDSPAHNGGPTVSAALRPGSPAIDTGDQTQCPATDGRFFVRADGHCDIGAYEVAATRDTTPPSCAVSAMRDGPPAQEDVTVLDDGSGIDGPDAVANIAVDNGSVAIDPRPDPVLSDYVTDSIDPLLEPLVLTATKRDQTQLTRWSFDVTDWAGNTTHCV